MGREACICVNSWLVCGWNVAYCTKAREESHMLLWPLFAFVPTHNWSQRLPMRECGYCTTKGSCKICERIHAADGHTDCLLLQYWLSIVLPSCTSACCFISWWANPCAGEFTKDNRQNMETDKETIRKYQFHTKCCHFHMLSYLLLSDLLDKHDHRKWVLQVGQWVGIIYLNKTFFRPWLLATHQCSIQLQKCHWAISSGFFAFHLYCLSKISTPSVRLSYWVHCLPTPLGIHFRPSLSLENILVKLITFALYVVLCQYKSSIVSLSQNQRIKLSSLKWKGIVKPHQKEIHFTM